MLSAVAAKLDADKKPCPDLEIFGPFGDRMQRALSGVGDHEVQGVKTRRRFRGHRSIVEWLPCWGVFKYTMLIAKASTVGPLDDYRDMLVNLSKEFDDRWGILSVADETNRREEWPIYRARLERMVRAGNPPEFFVVGMPWKSVITMAVEDTSFGTCISSNRVNAMRAKTRRPQPRPGLARDTRHP